MTAGCVAEMPPDCVDESDFPYVGSYCEYYNCLLSNYGADLEVVQDSDGDECWCKYYKSVCYLCVETGYVTGEFCEYAQEACTLSACCETTPAKTCFAMDDGPSPEPTKEPTPEFPGFVLDNNVASRVGDAYTCDPALEVELPECDINDATLCGEKADCRWRPNFNKCVGICQERPSEDLCAKNSSCVWNEERACCARKQE